MSEIKSPSLQGEDILALTDLSTVQEANGEYFVGSPATGEYVSMPAEGVYLIELLRSQRSLDEVTECFVERYGTKPELHDFIAQLIDLEFIEAINGEKLTPVNTRSRGIALLGGLTAGQCRWLLSRPVTVAALTAWLALPLLLLIGRHIPNASDVPADNENLFIIFLLLVPLGWLILCIHELAHSLTARALGCPAYTRFGNRMWNLVCETDLSSTYSLPRRQRYRPLLAGMTTDIVILDVCLVIEIYNPDALSAGVLAFMIFATLTYQACIFLRTDLYFVFTTATGLDNLVPMARNEARQLAIKLIRPKSKRPPTEADVNMSVGRRAVVRLYLLVCVVGLALGGYTAVMQIVPANIRVLSAAISALKLGPLSVNFWAAVLMIVLPPIVYSLLAWTFVRNYRERPRAAMASGRPLPR